MLLTVTTGKTEEDVKKIYSLNMRQADDQAALDRSLPPFTGEERAGYERYFQKNRIRQDIFA